MVSGDTIYPEDLPTLDGMSIPRQPGSFPDLGAGKTLRQVREAVERHYIAEALGRHKGNVTRASNALGIERTNLPQKNKTIRSRKVRTPFTRIKKSAEVNSALKN